MTDIQKPDMTKQWASGGNKTPPSDSQITTGWISGQIPLDSDFNFIDARQDQGLAYVLQKGIPEWDASTEYQANKSWVQYNGTLYRALLTSQNKQPNTQPAFWVDALSVSTTISVISRKNSGYTITGTDFGQAVALYGSAAQTFTFPFAVDNYGSAGVVVANIATATLTLSSASLFVLNGADVTSISVAPNTAYYITSFGTKWLVKQLTGSARIGGNTYKTVFSTSTATPKTETYPTPFLTRVNSVIGVTNNDTYPFVTTVFNTTGYTWGARNTGGSYVAGALSFSISVGE